MIKSSNLHIVPRRLVSMIVFLVLCLPASALEMALCANYDGSWTVWKSYNNFQITGSYKGFVLGLNDGTFLFKFTISDSSKPSSSAGSVGGYVTGVQEIPSKSKEWLEFDGTVEYYICDEYMTLYSRFSKCREAQFITKSWGEANHRPVKLVKSKAKIKIAPYRKHPKVYNIWFDNVGLGIDLQDVYF